MDESYRLLPLEHRGALATFEMLAGQTNNNGSMSLYSDKRRRMKVNEVIDYLASTPGMTSPKARSILNRLEKDGFVKVQPASKIVLLPYWTRWQVKGRGSSAPSPEAGRQRESRSVKRKELMHRADAYLKTVCVPNMSQPLCAQLLGDWMEKTARAGANLEGYEWKMLESNHSCWHKNGIHCRIIPGYLDNHNPVQRVIDGMDEDSFIKYTHEIARMCGGWEKCHRATPRQKCEAILKAKGVWTDD